MLSLAVLACTGDDDGRPPSSTEPMPGDTSSSGTPDDGDDGEDSSPTTTATDTTNSSITTVADTTASDDGASDTGTHDSSGSTGMMGGEPGDWLLTVDDAANPPVVVRIDTNTGLGEVVCPLSATSSFNSIALARDGTLYVHNAAQGRIERVDPCDCGFQIVGPTSVGTLEISIDGDDGLVGIGTTLDALYALDPETGLANAIGPLGLDFVGSGIAWSDSLPGVYAINDATTQLYSVSVETGNATLLATLSDLVTAPGIAYRASTDTAYVCDGNTLYELSTGSGILTAIGAIGLAGPCTSLAAPYLAEACLE